MSTIYKKSISRKKRKRKVILTIVLSSLFLLLIGMGIPGYFILKKRIRVFIVTDIQPEHEPITGIEVNISVSAWYYHSVPDPIKTFLFTNQRTKTIHICVLGYDPTIGNFPSIHYTNQTLQYTFHAAGTWQFEAGEYTTEITVT